MGKPPRVDTATIPAGKRARSDTASAQLASKKLLANNRYAILEKGDEPKVEKKEKVPPFFVKGFPEGLREKIDFYIGKGLKCTMRMCTDGIKLMVPAMNHYKAVEALLKQKNVEYFSHDIEATKPLKVVLRGLPDMQTVTLSDELKQHGLKPIQIFKMNRHDTSRKYRDQLYLVHLERNSTCLKDLQSIRALFHIVVIWEQYKPIHRDVTQCANCMLFGHGTRNCHMAFRCNNCGKQHARDACELMEDADPICANCGAAHRATSKTCPKRAEFIAIRKRASTKSQPGHRRVPENNGHNFPAIPQRRPIPVLPPLPLNNRSAGAASVPSTAGVHNIPINSSSRSYAAAAAPRSTSPPPGLSWQHLGAPSSPAVENADTLLTTAELVTLVSEVIMIQRTCRTRTEQLHAAVSLINKYGP